MKVLWKFYESNTWHDRLWPLACMTDNANLSLFAIGGSTLFTNFDSLQATSLQQYSTELGTMKYFMINMAYPYNSPCFMLTATCAHLWRHVATSIPVSSKELLFFFTFRAAIHLPPQTLSVSFCEMQKKQQYSSKLEIENIFLSDELHKIKNKLILITSS